MTESNEFFDDLTEILIVSLDGEVIASISSEDIIQKNDVVVRLNYGKPHEYVDKNGIIYVAKGGE